jgi:hypothetical protein
MKIGRRLPDRARWLKPSVTARLRWRDRCVPRRQGVAAFELDRKRLRAVTSTDGMTADFYSFDMKFLGETATRIINEVKGVTRIFLPFSSLSQVRANERNAALLAEYTP